MNTHRLAQALNTLASYLKSLPDTSLTELKELTLSRTISPKIAEDLDIIERLELLQSFQRIKKKALVELIQRYNLPVKVRPRDAASDLLTKVGKSLLENPHVLNKIKNESRNETDASKELLDALGILLKKRA